MERKKRGVTMVGNEESRVVARVSIRDGGRMTKKGRLDVAKWLELMAENLVEEGELYGRLFTARYIVPYKEVYNGKNNKSRADGEQVLTASGLSTTTVEG